MVPEGWENRRLSECAEEIRSGGTPKIGRLDYYGGGIPFLKIDDLTTNQGMYLQSASTSITEKAILETPAKLYPENTVLVTMYGTIGTVGITQVPMAANQAIAAFIGLKGVTRDFLAYLLSHEAPALAGKAGQTTQLNINGRILKAHEVLLPPLSEQRKIAAILSSVDDAIEKTQAVIDQVHVVKRGLMQQLLTRNARNGIGSPTEWTEECLGNLFTLQLGKMLNKRARETLPRFPYLGNRDVQWGRFDFSDLREMHFNEKERKKFRLIPGDLLVCEGGEIGRTALWTGGFDCYYQKAIHRLRVRDQWKVEPRFILHFMRFAAAEGLFTDLTSQSSIAHLTREKLALVQVPLPSLSEQRRIAAILSSVDDYTTQAQAMVRQAQDVKQGLMSVLLTGERRVTPDTGTA